MTRTPFTLAFIAALYCTTGLQIMAQGELTRLETWLALNVGLGTGWS